MADKPKQDGAEFEATKPKEEPRAEAPKVPIEQQKRSPQEWAKHLGAIGVLGVPRGTRYFKNYRHGAARNIHGWAAYEYHEAKPFALSLADYQAALKTAESAPPYTPHKPALTKYAAAEYREAAK